MALQILCELTHGPLSNTVIFYFIEQYCEIFYLQAFAYAVSSAWNILCLPDLKPAVFSFRKPSLTSLAPDYVRSLLLDPPTPWSFPIPALTVVGYPSLVMGLPHHRL